MDKEEEMLQSTIPEGMKSRRSEQTPQEQMQENPVKRLVPSPGQRFWTYDGKSWVCLRTMGDYSAVVVWPITPSRAMREVRRILTLPHDEIAQLGQKVI